MQKKIMFFIFLAGITLPSCSDNLVYEKEYEISDKVWIYSDTLNFDFEVEDTIALYSLSLEIEHSADYSFQNLYTKIYTKFPQGERIEEVLSLELADNIGNWVGNCSGEVCQLIIPIQENVYFNQNGHYQITMEQFMRTGTLTGIHSVGFLLKKAEKSR